MDVVKCAVSDAPRLAEMNQQLIVDEHSDNPMDLAQLEARMRGFLENGYEAYYFRLAGETMGYALVDVTRQPVYLRQFFILRKHRQKHYGTAAFAALRQALGTDEIDLEVLSVNSPGQRFWASLGFQEQSRYLRYRSENQDIEMGM